MSVKPNAWRVVTPTTPEPTPEPRPMTPTERLTDALTWLEEYHGPSGGDTRTTEERVRDYISAYRAEVLREATDEAAVAE